MHHRAFAAALVLALVALSVACADDGFEPVVTICDENRDGMARQPADVPADVAEAPDDAIVTESGLAYKVLGDGPGEDSPTTQDFVTVHYSGWTTDGAIFDSSVPRGRPSTFPLNALIAGWVEGLQLMQQCDEYRFWIPEDLAYQGQPGYPEGTLVFDVELVEIQTPQ